MNKKINILLVVLGIGVCVYALYDYYIIRSQYNSVCSNIDTEIERIEVQKSACEYIAELKYGTLESGYYQYHFHNKLKYSKFPQKYIELSSRRDSLSVECSTLMTSHCCMCLDIYSFFKDAISEELIFGIEQITNSACEAIILTLNDSLYNPNRKVVYKAKKGDTLRSELKFLYFNHKLGKLDSLVAKPREFIVSYDDL